jgi:hypothetical protein
MNFALFGVETRIIDLRQSVKKMFVELIHSGNVCGNNKKQFFTNE